MIMKDDNKEANGVRDVLPEDKKNLVKDMPDHLKSPMNELEDKKDTVKKALDDKKQE